ncbi:ABC transporter permease [Brevibacillus laterosporus]|uniref:ABC transporter permease n=2 Tax=Brevibacillus laterosporus TaxID=1465 RepID=A0AAP8U642_BRELA|nr:ABC transporter permease [Brevibacillus laterosporus]AYB40677.1 ABC transporter permease [Brevibacillus laterosporus]MBG9771709.1 ABC transporter permease [Brevibacillus laterosporus]MBG9787600.1 ABC transporter permease [Brevibacillus laterosporus]MBG9796208.1 ABC transporter permease [Brevibacillus laterosporus]MBM7107121.1 Spermidine/putrescine transport system permease protein PotB [Brevibacillus laterosporus]
MKNKGKLLALPGFLWLTIFFLVPMLFVVVLSFLKRGVYGQIVYEFTLANYARFFESLYVQIFIETLLVSLGTTFICLLLGYPLAYMITRLDRKWQNMWLLLVMIPFWINFLVRSYAWVIILRTQGLVNTVLQSLGLIDQPLTLLYTPGAVLLGMVYALLPFIILPIYVSLEQLDRKKLEAAYDLGATPAKTFWHITLPLTMPGVVSGCILVFVSSLGMFVVPDVMGGAKSSLFGNVIQNQFLSARDWPFGSALSMVIVLFSIIMIYLYYRATKMQEKQEGRG